MIEYTARDSSGTITARCGTMSEHRASRHDPGLGRTTVLKYGTVGDKLGGLTPAIGDAAGGDLLFVTRDGHAMHCTSGAQSLHRRPTGPRCRNGNDFNGNGRKSQSFFSITSTL